MTYGLGSRINGMLSECLKKAWPKNSDGEHEFEDTKVLKHIMTWPSFASFLRMICRFYGTP